MNRFMLNSCNNFNNGLGLQYTFKKKKIIIRPFKIIIISLLIKLGFVFLI